MRFQLKDEASNGVGEGRFFEQLGWCDGNCSKSCPGANPCAAVLHNVIIGQRWFS